MINLAGPTGLSRAAESNLPIEEADESFLREVPVMRQDFENLFLPHDVHGYAVHKAVLLVGAPLVQGQSGEKRFVRLGNDFDARIVEDLLHQPAGQSSRVVPVTETAVRSSLKTSSVVISKASEQSADLAVSAHASPGRKMASQ